LLPAPLVIRGIDKIYRIEANPMLYEDLSEKVLAACFEVSGELGAGFLESVYEKALVIALRQKGLDAECQVPS